MSLEEVATDSAAGSGWKESIARFFMRHGWARQIWESLAAVPVIGRVMRRASRAIVPEGKRAWVQIPAGRLAGIWLALDPRFEAQYFKPDYENAVQSLIEKFLLPNQTFYDVGAHIGVMSLLAARIVGQRGCVVALEADPSNAQTTRSHAERNMCPQIHVVQKAAWSSCGALEFQRDARQSSHNQGRVQTQNHSEGESESVSIEGVTLDSLQDKFPPPDVVKIDVEGAEAEVLSGGEQTFDRSHPKLICEIHDGNASKRVSAWLAKHNYQWTVLGNETRFPHHIFAEFADTRQLRGQKTPF